MSNLTFVRTRHTYDSYTDYWRLVELSGFPIVYVDEMDLGDVSKTYVVSPFNGELLPLKDKDRRCRILLWNLERPAGSGDLGMYKKHIRQHIKNRYIDWVIVSDKQLAVRTGFHYVPFGSHKDLGVPGSDKSYDFIHLMCYSNRRSFLFDTPSSAKSAFSGCSIAPNGWGEQRHQMLMRSWYMLNIHQDDDQYVEPLRFALAAAYGLPILTENLLEVPAPYTAGVVQFPLQHAGAAMRMAYTNRRDATNAAMQMREQATGMFSFRNCVERYLKV